MISGLFAISNPSHAMAIRQSLETFLVVLFRPFTKESKTGFPMLMMLLEILLHHESVPESCKFVPYSFIGSLCYYSDRSQY